MPFLCACGSQQLTQSQPREEMKPFITRWDTRLGKEDKNSVAITTWKDHPDAEQAFVYDYDIDWENDGIYDEFHVTGNAKHHYPEPGVYEIAIRGTFSGWTFAKRIPSKDEATNEVILKSEPDAFFPNKHASKLLAVIEWGDISWQTMQAAFYGCKRLAMFPTASPNLKHVTNMRGMFTGARSFNQPLSAWNVSEVTSMQRMFYGAAKFKQNLRKWNLSKLETPLNEIFDNDSQRMKAFGR